MLENKKNAWLLMLLFQTILNYKILQDENTTVWREKIVKFEKCLVIGVPGGVTKSLEKWAAHSDKSKDYSIRNNKIVKVLELKGERYSWYIFSGSNNRANIPKQHHLEKNTILTEVIMIIISNIILEKTNSELQQINKYKYTKTK